MTTYQVKLEFLKNNNAMIEQWVKDFDPQEDMLEFSPTAIITMEGNTAWSASNKFVPDKIRIRFIPSTEKTDELKAFVCTQAVNVKDDHERTIASMICGDALIIDGKKLLEQLPGTKEVRGGRFIYIR